MPRILVLLETDGITLNFVILFGFDEIINKFSTLMMMRREKSKLKFIPRDININNVLIM